MAATRLLVLGRVLAAVTVVAACSLVPPPAGIQLTIPAVQEVPALPVTVVDHAGIVREATPAAIPVPPDFAGETTVEAVDGRDDAVVLRWTGGGCDDRAIVTIDEVGDRYQATVDTASSAMACSAVGVFRAVLLTLSEPVAPDAFEGS